MWFAWEILLVWVLIEFLFLLQCMCSGCAKVLRYQTNRCPICRQPVERLLEIKVNNGPEEWGHELHHYHSVYNPFWFVPCSLLQFQCLLHFGFQWVQKGMLYEICTENILCSISSKDMKWCLNLVTSLKYTPSTIGLGLVSHEVSAVESTFQEDQNRKIMCYSWHHFLVLLFFQMRL